MVERCEHSSRGEHYENDEAPEATHTSCTSGRRYCAQHACSNCKLISTPRPEPAREEPDDWYAQRFAEHDIAARDARIAELEAALRVADGLVAEMIDAGRSHFTRGPRTRHWDEGLATVRAALAGKVAK